MMMYFFRKLLNINLLISRKFKLFLSLSILSFSSIVFGQENNDSIKRPLLNLKIREQDSIKIVGGTADNQIVKDTSNTEISPLDINDNRGIYILADDGDLQFRILGSIRFSALFDNKLMSDKSRFSTYDIPTGEANFNVLNYYNSLEFSRIGYEVTRKTSVGNIFIRIETDFAGASNSYRIRHAYAQFKKFLVGQTWSLFSNVRAQNMSVDRNGPPGTISLRTPQLRYSFDIKKKDWKADVALEYSLVEANINDSLTLNYLNVQTVPNLTARIAKTKDYGYLQISGIAAPITGLDSIGNKSTFMGFGVSLAGFWRNTDKSRLSFQGTYSYAVTHFINEYRNSRLDLVYNPETENFEAISSWSGNVSYQYKWNENLISNASFGMAHIISKNFQPDQGYDNGYSSAINAFYTIVQGARVGVEYIYGKRVNKGSSLGNASRLWLLIYYDF